MVSCWNGRRVSIVPTSRCDPTDPHTLITLNAGVVRMQRDLSSALRTLRLTRYVLAMTGLAIPWSSVIAQASWITPQNGTATATSNTTGNHVTFTVHNNSVTQGFNWGCTPDGQVSACSLSPVSANLQQGQYLTVTATYSTASSGTGHVVMSGMSHFGDFFSGQYTITVNGPPVFAPIAGVVLANHDRDNLSRSSCLTISAGDGAEVNCGDLLAYHAMPALKTMNVARSLTLVYNSAAAEPRPRVAAVVSLGAGSTPQNVFAKLTINGVTQDSAFYTAWPGSTSRQVSLAFDGSTLTSGIYPFTLLARSNYSGGSNELSVTDTLLVVNRETSEFGAGWYLSGVESLVLPTQSNGPMLWVGGDGSARMYRNVGTGQWQAPAGAYRDSIIQVGSNYERRGQHGVRITFDGAGRHIQSRNRLGHVTTFNWVSNRLTSIVLPPASATYQLAYDGNGKLDKITDPAGRVLDATVTGGLLAQLVDPDNQCVSFGYDGEQRLTSRTNRRLAVNHYYYDNNLR